MRGSILVLASVALVALCACARTDPCAALKAEIAQVERDGVARTSHRIDLRSAISSRARFRIIEQRDFMPAAAGLPVMHACLTPEWAGRVEETPRETWRAPAVVFERQGAPSVILFDDKRALQIVIEPGD